jgi:glutathione peroxidase-family protein
MEAYKEEVDTELIDLDEAEGWIHLVNTCDRRGDSVVVINTAARNNLAVKQYEALSIAAWRSSGASSLRSG